MSELKHYDYSVQQLIKHVQDGGDADTSSVGRLEWGYLPILRNGDCQPESLFTALRTDARFFVELLAIQYRPRNGTRSAEPLPEEEQARAQLAYELLRDFSQVPGFHNDQERDVARLRSWIQEARHTAAELDRLEICDSKIGELLANSPTDTDDGSWPARGVRQIMEEVGTSRLFRGFSNGIMNSRGIIGRTMTEGGDQERELTKKYRDCSEACRIDSPQVASSLENVAASYEQQANHEDTEATLRSVGR